MTKTTEIETETVSSDPNVPTVQTSIDKQPIAPEPSKPAELTEYIVKYQGATFDILKFLDSHPAGRAVIDEHKQLHGDDITDVFDDVGHSEYAKKVMLKYKIRTEAALEEERQARKNLKRQPITYDLNFVIKKLFTHEDKFFFHKFFGFLALASYAYRHFYVLPTTNSLGFTGTLFDNLTLFVHFMLSFSAIIFHVLEKRIVEKPLIIYEEYRLHAILFTGRAIFVSLFGLYAHHFMSYETQKWALALSIMTIHLLVDYVTSKHGTKGVTAVRVNDGSDLRALKLFYSYYQFAALGSHLIVSSHLNDLGFNTCIAIQSSAFLMTLRRKSLIRWEWHAVWYSIALALSYYYMWLANGTTFFIYVGMAFFLRTQLNVNKYLLWAGYVVGIYYFNLQKY